MKATMILMLLLGAYMALLFATVPHEQANREEAKAVCNLAPYQGRYLTCKADE